MTLSRSWHYFGRFAIVVSVLLGVSTAILWARCEPIAGDRLHMTWGPSYDITSRDGCVFLSVASGLAAEAPSQPTFEIERDSGFGMGLFEEYVIHKYGSTYGPFGMVANEVTDPSYKVPIHIAAVKLPYWFLLAAFSFVPLLFGVKAFRRTKQNRAGFCGNCGYDLRATPGRCPECGNAVVDAQLASKPSSRSI